MLKDVQREFLTVPKKLDEIMENLKVINEMMADDGPVPLECWYARCENDTE